MAWLAGIMEGEGSFCMITQTQRKNGKEYTYRKPRVQLGMSDEDVVAKAQEIAGVGNLHDYEDSRAENYKHRYLWHIADSEDAIEFMLTIRPYMGLRRKAQIDAVIAEYEQIREEKRISRTYCHFSGCEAEQMRGRSWCRDHWNMKRRFSANARRQTLRTRI